LPPDHPLWSTPNVLITPHVAIYVHAVRTRRDRRQDRFGTIGGAKIPFEARGGEEAQGGSSTEVGPRVRIRFPPAASLSRQ
jgi:hypothetical protein